jgi:hypothetical protein
MIKKTRFQLLDLSLFIRARARLIGILALTLGTLFLTRTPAQANAVLNLQNVSVTNSSMSFTWSNQTGRSYILAISSHSTFSSRVTSGTTPADQNTTSYFSLAPNTTYFFRVKVSTDSDANYNGSFSTSTLANLPGPSTAAVVNISSIGINISANGNPLTPRTTYQVQMATDTTYTPFSSSTTVLLTSTFTGLAVNTTYYFRVQAFSRLMVSTAFNLDMTTVTLSRTPGVDSFIVGTSSIEVRVTTNTNPALTRVDVSSSAGFGVANTTTGVFVPNVLVTTLTLSNLLANSTFQIQFRTMNWQLRASSVSATVLSTATEANPPSNSTFSITNISSITIFWNSNGNQLTPPTSYQMSVSTSSDFIMNSSSNTFLLQATSATLRPNTTYFFQVRTNRRLGGTSAFNAALSTATRSLAPGIFNYAMRTSSAEIRLTTNTNPATTRVDVTTGIFNVFNINVSSFHVSNSSFSAFYNMNITTVAFTNLTPNATYQFRFRTVNWQNIPSSNSAIILTTATFANPPGPSIFNVAPATVTISSISVFWNNNGNQLTPPTSYQMRVSTSSDFAVFSTSVTFNTFATSSTLRSNTTYFFRVAAYQRFGGTTAFNTDASTVTLARAPGFAGFNIGVSSIAVRFSTNTNPARTEVDLTSGAYELTTSSFAAFYNSMLITTVTISNLEPNTTYQFVARAENWQNVASSQIVIAIATCTYTYVPGGSTATAVNLSSMTVAWTPNGNPLTPPTSYEMQISSAVNFTPFSSSVTFNLSADTGTLLPNTSYFFRLRSFNRFGAPSIFNIIRSTVTLANPPGDSTSTVVTASTISVSWTANGNPLPPSTSYQMQISTSADFVPSGSSTTFRLLATTNTLRPNTTYFFQVRTFNRLGLPTTFNALISTPTLSVAPGFVNFIMGTSSAEVRLSTNGNPASTEVDVTTGIFNVNTSSFQVSNSSFAAFYNMAVTSVTLANLAPNTTYQFLFRTENWQNVPSSNSATILSTATFANPPLGSTVTAITPSTLTVTWDTNNNPLTPPTSYQIQFSTSAQFTTFLSSTTSVLPASTGTLLTNTTYFMRVTAFNRFGGSSAFNSIISTPTASTAPGIPGFIVYNTSISVRLSTNTNPARTEVDISSGNFELTTSSFSAFYNTMLITTVTLSNLTPNSTYQILARTENWQNIPSSNSAIVITTATFANVPGGSTVTAISPSTLTVTWDPNGNPLTPPTSYQIQFSTSSQFVPFLSSTTFNLSAATGTLLTNTTYFIRVTAFNLFGGNSAFNSVISTPTASVAPGVSGFQLFNTSASVMVSTNTNPAGTEVDLSSGAFEVTTSSFSNFYNLPVTTVSLVNLNPNTIYQLVSRTENWQNIASSQVVVTSSSTLAYAPGNSTSTLVGVSSVSVFWTPNGNPLTPPTSYEMQISTASNFTPFTSSVTFNLWASSTGLNANTTYFFQVRAFNRLGVPTTFNLILSTPTASTAPGVAGFQLFNTSASVMLSTNTNPAGTRVDVTSGAFEVTTSSFSNFYNLPVTTVSLTNLNPNTLYQFLARTDNWQNVGSTQVIVTSSSTLAYAPGNSTSTLVGVSSVSVFWTPNGNPLTPPTSYEMQISTASNFTPFTSSVTFNLWASSTGLNANTTYFFQVRSFNRLGVPTTFNLLLSTPTLSPAPGVPGFKIFNTSASVMLSTNTNPAGTRVDVTSGAFEVTTSSFSNFYALPVTTVSLTNLNPNTVYSLFARTLNWQGLGSTSSVIAQTTATLPNTPSGTAFTQVNTTSMSISWSNNGNPLTPPTSYQVEISSAPNFTGTVYSSSVTFTLACTSMTLTPNSSYYFHVRAEGIGGTDSIYDTTIASYTKAATPATLASTYTAVSYFSITVNWGANSNPSNTRYTLDISSAANFTGNVTTSSNTFSVFATTGGLTENTTRYFRVQAFNQWGYPSDYLIFGATATAGNPPSAITNLSTFTATNLGEVEVRWTAPGKDGLFGTLPSGTSFYIATTTVLSNAVDPNYWSTRRNNSADIIIATSNVNPASNQGILLTGLEINSTYFMRAWTQDEKGNFSDLSNGATFYPNFEEIGVLIIGSTNYDFGFIDLAVSTVSVSSFTVRNVGNVKHDFSLSATTMTPNTPWSISTTSGTDQAIVWGGFSTSRPAVSNFGTEDILLNNSQLSDASKYAIGTSSGTAVGINEDRYLWMRVDMPLITSTTEQQRIKVVITGSKAP